MFERSNIILRIWLRAADSCKRYLHKSSEMNLDRETAAEQVRQKYKLTQEKTEEVMERYWGETKEM